MSGYVIRSDMLRGLRLAWQQLPLLPVMLSVWLVECASECWGAWLRTQLCERSAQSWDLQHIISVGE